MLSQSAMGFGAIGLANLLGTNLAAKNSKISLPSRNVAPRAKRVIFLFLNGAPSHIDTFDPKPGLLKYEGKKPEGKLYKATKAGFLPSPLKFTQCGQSGLSISESLPNLSMIADDLCVIRSMHCDVPNHEPALLQMHTGVLQPTRPSIGAWTIYGLGTENENLPGYVVLRPSPKTVVGPALWSAGFLPAQYQASSVITKDMSLDKLLANIKSPGSAKSEQRRQLELLAQMNQLHNQSGRDDAILESHISTMETAYRMQIEATDAFDISSETAKTKESYGSSKFAQSCLLARRLAERGVRFTTVYYTKDSSNQPWDTHQNHYESHANLCADADKAAAALINDLKSRGLLEDTLVVFGGEFGRTPYAQNHDKKKPGRDHHHTAFSMMLAGAGLKGGFAYGQSDELGMNAVENPVHVHDLHATILHLLGIDHEKLTYRYAGRDFRLTDVYGRVVHELMS